MIKVEQTYAHGDKLSKLLLNGKLPASDKPRVEEALKRYLNWRQELDSIDAVGEELLAKLVSRLNEYRNYVDLELVFDSPNDFLYRQKGQLKLDNSVLEEFLPRLFDERLVPGFARLTNLVCGPGRSFAGLTFDSPFIALASGGVYIKLKNQDFSVTKPHRVTISEIPSTADRFVADVAVCYFATEIKTNLDKTMFQEASATAGELKRAVSGCKYILLCEWLDMTPINTKLTSIDEVIVLRKAKRLASNIRDDFSTYAGRQRSRSLYERNLNNHVLSVDCFARFIFHLNECFPLAQQNESNIVLDRGYF